MLFQLTFDPTKISVTDAVYSQVLFNNNPTVTINNGNGTIDIGFNSLQTLPVGLDDFLQLKCQTLGSSVSAQMSILSAEFSTDLGSSVLAGKFNGKLISDRKYGILSKDETGTILNDIGLSDALKVLRAAVGLEKLSEDDEIAADVTGDGFIKSNDAISILRRIAGYSDKFGAETD
jgi:hypothetical protein